jgi:hypothetical protein
MELHQIPYLVKTNRKTHDSKRCHTSHYRNFRRTVAFLVALDQENLLVCILCFLKGYVVKNKSVFDEMIFTLVIANQTGHLKDSL